MLRIPSFPKPYPDEILYGIIARYNIIRGILTKPELLQELFGEPQHRILIHLPMKIRKICARGFINQTESQVISNYTLYPFYSFALTTHAASKMYDAMIDGKKGPFVAGLRAKLKNTPSGMRICPDCLKADFEKYGEPYWHRSHQIPGSCVCHIHNVLLYDRCPICHLPICDPYNRGYQITPTRCPNGHSLTNSVSNADERLYLLARNNHQTLLTGFLGQQVIRGKYFNILLKRGFANSVRVTEYYTLTSEFKEYFSDALLSKLGIEVPQLPTEPRMTNWIHQICTNRAAIKQRHPLYNVLFIQYLCGTISKFLAESKYDPFGEGPWPCHNLVCPSYKKM